MTEEVSLFVTSNNQGICTLNHIAENAGLEIPTGWVLDNATTIEINGLGETCTVQMIHPLKVTDPDRFVSLEKVNEKFKGELPIPLAIGKKKLVMRHGQAGHNVSTATLNESHDASLTSLGREQAINSGIAIYKHSGGHLSNLKAHCSDLLRTMETAELILQQFPEDLRVDTCEVCIEAHENTRAIGAEHHWKKNDPLREIAIDPYVSLDKLELIAPTKTEEQRKKMRIENLPKNDPIGNESECIKEINGMKIDWSVYVAKLKKGYAEGKTFGQVASEKTLFEIIFEID